jgi:hypothetical protein
MLMGGPVTLRKIVAPNGLPGWRVSVGANEVGTIFNPDVRDWRAVAPDGTRFGAPSKPKAVQRLRIHAAASREPAP